MEPVLLEVKVVLNQRSAGVRIIPNAIAMNDGIDQGERTEEDNEKDSLIAGRHTFAGR
jgi:hypothetical protein